MRIGIDFDNTIVRYGDMFHDAAVQQGLIPDTIPKSKESVRDYLNASGRADDFTRLQGYVYGPGIEHAELWPGVDAFVTAATAQGHFVCVVSHKSTRPLLGPAHDLRGHARAFLRNTGFVGLHGIPMRSVYFEDSQAAKASRVRALRIDVFIDDLAEFLLRPDFPYGTAPLLFDPFELKQTSLTDGLRSFKDWTSISRWLIYDSGSE